MDGHGGQYCSDPLLTLSAVGNAEWPHMEPFGSAKTLACDQLVCVSYVYMCCLSSGTVLVPCVNLHDLLAISVGLRFPSAERPFTHSAILFYGNATLVSEVG